MCTDYKERAGFKYDRSSIGYNCFNCSYTTRFEDGGCFIPKKLAALVEKLGGDMHELSVLKFRLMSREHVETEVNIDGITVFRTPSTVQPLPEFATLESGLVSGNAAAIRVATYLLDVRKMPLPPANVYYSTSEEGDWNNRAILPFTMWGRTVGWIGRDIIPRSSRPKYKTIGPKGNLLFNYDAAVRSPMTHPLWIVEGQFDALRIGGVALSGNTISDHQEHWIETSTRRKVVVPDKGKSGLILAEQALDRGWEVSLPDIGSCKDVDAAVLRYGDLYCTSRLLTGIVSGDEAYVKARAYCLG